MLDDHNVVLPVIAVGYSLKIYFLDSALRSVQGCNKFILSSQGCSMHGLVAATRVIVAFLGFGGVVQIGLRLCVMHKRALAEAY